MQKNVFLNFSISFSVLLLFILLLLVLLLSVSCRGLQQNNTKYNDDLCTVLKLSQIRYHFVHFGDLMWFLRWIYIKNIYIHSVDKKWTHTKKKPETEIKKKIHFIYIWKNVQTTHNLDKFVLHSLTHIHTIHTCTTLYHTASFCVYNFYVPVDDATVMWRREKKINKIKYIYFKLIK